MTTTIARQPANNPEPDDAEGAASALGPGGPGGVYEGAGRRRKRRNRRRIVLTGLGIVMLLVGGVAFAGYRAAMRLPANIKRIDGAFAGLDESTRPTKPANVASSMNFLLVGTDSRSDEPTTGRDANAPAWTYGAQRSDVMMLVHLAADRQSAAVISVPRDSWVPIPGKGTMKLNAAYSWGGPPLLINTMEQLTGVRVDHFAVVDFEGLKQVVNVVDGVDITLAAPAAAGKYQLASGSNHLDGERALAYVRERHALEKGDLDRVRRQQNLLRSIMNRINTINPVRDPVLTYDLLNAATKSVSVDSSLTDDKIQQLAMTSLGLRGGNIAFLTAPVTGTGMEGDQSVVYLNSTKCAQLWAALHDDTVLDYLATHRNEQLPETPR